MVDRQVFIHGYGTRLLHDNLLWFPRSPLAGEGALIRSAKHTTDRRIVFALGTDGVESRSHALGFATYEYLIQITPIFRRSQTYYTIGISFFLSIYFPPNTLPNGLAGNPIRRHRPDTVPLKRFPPPCRTTESTTCKRKSKNLLLNRVSHLLRTLPYGTFIILHCLDTPPNRFFPLSSFQL